MNFKSRKINSNLLIVLVIGIHTSCISYKNLELGDVNSTKINKVSNGGIEIQVGMGVNNPNAYKIKVKKVEVDLMVNDVKLGRVNLTKKVVLPKESNAVQDFAVTTQLSNLISALPSLIMGGDVNFQMKGYIKGKVFIFSKKFPVEAEKKISSKDLKLF